MGFLRWSFPVHFASFSLKPKLSFLVAVHYWLRELGRELEERITADRQEHLRAPRTLTVAVEASFGESVRSLARACTCS